MENKSYYVSKSKKKKEAIYLEYDKMDGYQVNPKVTQKNGIEVSKIVFVKPEFSEKIIRKKIDHRIELLLEVIRNIEDGTDSSEGTIKKGLMDAEKLRIQIINNYIKYLGHTYGSLTLRKIQIIINSLREKLYILKELERQDFYDDYRENKRGGR